MNGPWGWLRLATSLFLLLVALRWIDVATGRRAIVKPMPLAMVLLIQCDRPLAFYGVDTGGRQYWLDATTLSRRQLSIVQQTVDQNHYMERLVPCVGHSANQLPGTL